MPETPRTTVNSRATSPRPTQLPGWPDSVATGHRATVSHVPLPTTQRHRQAGREAPRSPRCQPTRHAPDRRRCDGCRHPRTPMGPGTRYRGCHVPRRLGSLSAPCCAHQKLSNAARGSSGTRGRVQGWSRHRAHGHDCCGSARGGVEDLAVRGSGRACLNHFPSPLARNSSAGQSLTFTEIRITGPGSAPYQLGELMYFYDGETHVGTIEAVVVLRGGHEVHLDRFVPSAIPMRQNWVSRNLVLVEAVAFLAEHFAAVTTIRVSLNTPIERYDDFLRVARARAQLLHRIGAQRINIIPNFAPSNRGNFTVSGVWKRNPQSLKALNAALRHEREAHRSRRAAAATVRGRLAELGERIRRLLFGTTE
jgi:hypothetical protein